MSNKLFTLLKTNIPSRLLKESPYEERGKGGFSRKPDELIAEKPRQKII
jgi:hypothetical protein